MVINPPSTGPRANPMAKRIITKVVYSGNLAGGTSSYSIIVVIPYMPEPPTPWRTRNMILIQLVFIPS